ncbi:hypothetical protein MMC08_005996 [Hypocenomyce scalaris]|nr:hypothetical protein [Hypocenomyce scalaris]
MGNDEKADTGSATAGSRRLLLGSGVVRGRLGRQEIGLGDLKSRASEDVAAQRSVDFAGAQEPCGGLGANGGGREAHNAEVEIGSSVV